MAARQKVFVVVPTRERPYTLEYCLRTITAWDSDALQIIVSDNYSCDHTREVVDAAKDPRIKYVNTGRRVSMSHNFEFALNHVDEGWVIVLGDDDGLLQNRVGRTLEMLEESGRLALTSPTCFYRWPSSRKDARTNLAVPMGKGHRIKNSRKSLLQLMRGVGDYSDLPMLYTGGIVHSSLLHKARSRGGDFFRSCIPDVYSAVALASVTDEFICLHDPFAISGISKNSNGGNIDIRSEHLGSGSEYLKFMSESNIPLHPAVPTFRDGRVPPFVPALVYESYLQASHLHQDFAGITAGQQFTRFFSHPLAARRVVQEWLEDFAALHKLQVDTARLAEGTGLRPRLDGKWALVKNAISLYRVDDSFGLPLDTVYEASVVASTILATRPSRAQSYWRTFRRRLALPH